MPLFFFRHWRLAMLPFFTASLCCGLPSCKKRANPAGDAHGNQEKLLHAATAGAPKADEELASTAHVGQSRAGDGSSGAMPDWERKLQDEMRTVASEAQILDDPGAYTRAVDHLRTSLGGYSIEELSKIAGALSDPKAASIQRVVMLSAALAEMAARSPEAALKFMMENFNAETRKDSGMAKFVYPEIARKDPALLSAWLSKTTTDWTKPTADLYEGVKALAAASAEAAFALIESTPASANRDALYSAAFRQLGETNPADAVQRLAVIDAKYRSSAMSQIAQGIAVQNPQSAIEWLKQNRDIPVEPSGLRLIFFDWFTKDNVAAVASLKSLPEPMRLNVLSDPYIMDRLQRKDPEATLDLLSRLVPTRSNSQIILQNLNALLGRAPDRVVAWLDNQTADHTNLPLQSRVYTLWAQQNPEAAYAALQARPNLLQNEGIVAGLAQGMAANPLPELVKWADNLPPEQRDHFKQAAIGFAAEKQPRSVMGYLATQPNGGNSEIYQKVGNSLAALDVNEAKNWSVRQAGARGEAAVAGVVGGLMKSDAEGASIWLAQMPPGPSRNAGIKVLIEEIAESDPAAAAEWRKSLN